MAAEKPTPQPPWPAGRPIAVGGEQRTAVTAPKQVAPVLAQADVLIVESSFDGCFLAQRVATPRRRVILTSTGTSLPREMAMALRPWVSRDDLTRAPADVRSFLASCKESSAGGEIILDMIKLTEGLEDRILDKGVGLYYDLHPCGVQMAGRDVTAVIFACKGGLVALEAGTVVDCTPDASLAALAGAETRKRGSATKGLIVRYNMLCANPPKQPALTVRTVPQLVDGRVVMHGDFAEFRLRLAGGGSAFDGSVRGLAARRLAATAAIELKQSGALGSGAFARGGDVLLEDPTRRIVSRSAGGKLTLDACRPKGIDNLLVCSPTVDVNDAVAAALVEPLGGPSLADVIAGAPWSELSKGQSDQAPTVRLSCAPPGSGEAIKGQAMFTELSPIYRTSGAVSIGGIRLGVIADCDVLVVGAGTSGAPAAQVAAENGADAIVVEKYGDVGGTHTIGGVSKYWFGRPTEFVDRIDRDAKAMMTRAAMPKCMGRLSVLMRASPRLVTHCLAVGTVVDGRTVSGAVVVTPGGLGVIRARRVIDATGDGDIAARAGAKTEYGTRRDAMTLWYSFAQYQGAKSEAARHFAYVVDPRDPTDMTRAIIAGRRYKKRGVSFPQVYLTPRESRRISGGYRVTVSDILAQRRFEDMILICRANFDIKGIADSDLSFSGYVEWARLTNYSVQIPYRAILPRDLDNVLVVGKAYSVTHDALSLARMQRDMMAMGGAAGLIAAESVRAGTPLARIDAKALQAKLVK
ncbi:FAD-dependent oxidoreductase, partial [Planctomycetota bacterium]